VGKDLCDTILYNGKIVTVDDDFTVAEAVAIRNRRFLKVGSIAEVRALAGPNTKEIESLRKAVLPVIDTFIELFGENS
jgi:predicted amidohydrolase YtcJ